MDASFSSINRNRNILSKEQVVQIPPTLYHSPFLLAYLHDYSMLSKNMGHKHYAVWNDTTLTFDDGQWFQVSKKLEKIS